MHDDWVPLEETSKVLAEFQIGQVAVLVLPQKQTKFRVTCSAGTAGCLAYEESSNANNSFASWRSCLHGGLVLRCEEDT